MINWIQVIWGMLMGVILHSMTFLQLQGPLRWGNWNRYYWLLVLLGLPISWGWMNYTKLMSTAFGGQMWPQRLIGFGLGASIFAIGSWLIFKEPLTIKTIVCLSLALLIVLIQIFWK